MTTSPLPGLRQCLTRPDHGAPVDPDLSLLIEDIASAARVIADHVRAGALRNLLGVQGSTNVQGEDQKKLDVIADQEFARICANSPKLAALVSEEVDEVTWLKEPEAGDFLLYYDPLDGSSNLDVNLSVGSIFSVMRVERDGERNVLRGGRNQICAGYAVYGPSLMLVLTTGDGVNGFTCEAGTGEFRLTHPGMQIPPATSEFAINSSRQRHWEAPVRRYVDACLAGPDGPRGRSFNMRWTASMVADVHRILTRGGVFLYPRDVENASKGGKLRLMYEANPMALIVEQAGGAASVGGQPILDVTPTAPHQRVPVILGSREEVAYIDSLHG